MNAVRFLRKLKYFFNDGDALQRTVKLCRWLGKMRYYRRGPLKKFISLPREIPKIQNNNSNQYEVRKKKL